jgi:hypothetical protein
MIGLVAALAATVGDLLLLATSNAPRPGFEWLPPASEAALVVGTYLGVVALPLYGLGYREVAARCDARVRRSIVALGTAGGVLGGTTHGLTGLVIHVEQTGGAAAVDPVTLIGRYGAYLLPLWTTITCLSVVGAGVYFITVLAGRSSLPRWMALANPVALTLALVAIGQGSTTGEAFLVPAAPNVAHVLFFGLVAAHRRTLDMERGSRH